MTEDDAVGGLEAVLARELEKYGLPPQAGLTGLLTHLEGNRALTEAVLNIHIEMLTRRVKLAEAQGISFSPVIAPPGSLRRGSD